MLDSAFHFQRADEWLYEPAGLKPDNRARILALKAWQVRNEEHGSAWQSAISDTRTSWLDNR